MLPKPGVFFYPETREQKMYRYAKMYLAAIDHMIFYGDPPGEGSNQGLGLIGIVGFYRPGRLKAQMPNISSIPKETMK